VHTCSKSFSPPTVLAERSPGLSSFGGLR
jgi:hypothetical protein